MIVRDGSSTVNISPYGEWRASPMGLAGRDPVFYAQLESERKFAEASYQHALQSLDQARATADRQRVFLASFIPPSLPEEALYPRRWRSLGIIGLLAFAVWGIGTLAAQSIRDHVS